MKRKAEENPGLDSRKSAKVEDYCSIQPRRDSQGDPIWPAPSNQILAARAFLREWYDQSNPSLRTFSYFISASAQKTTVIVPDKDADGLSAGVIVHRTLVKLGLDSKHLNVHLVQKGSNIHQEYERQLVLEKKPNFVIVLDQGSRGGPPVIEDEDAKSIIIDHHLSDEFPKDAIVGVLSSVLY